MYKKFWSEVITLKNSQNGHAIANCSFCGEQGGHFYGNTHTGLWDCKKCGRSGNAFTFLRDIRQLPDAEIFKELERYGITSTSEFLNLPTTKPPKTFSIKAVEYFIAKLSADEREKFAKERGLSVSILVKYRLGINDAGEFTLPIFDTQGNVRNILRKALGGSTISAVGGEALLFGIEDLNKGENVFVVEGPWSAMALKERGFRAVGTCGAGVLKDEQMELFKGKEVYLLPDNDDAGRKGAQRICQKLKGIAQSTYLVNLPIAEKKDVRDFFKDGGTVDQLDEFIKQSRETPAAQSQPSRLFPIPSYDEYVQQEFPPVEYLIGSDDCGALLQKEAVTAITAEFGVGKTLLGLNIAWAITKGEESFLGFPVKKGRGLYLIFEGGNSSFQKRLKAIGGGKSNPDLYVKCIGHAFDLTPRDKKTEDQVEFENEIERLKVDFVVLDNAANVFSGDENDQKQVKPFMDYLHSVKEQFKISFIILRHWKKTQQKGGSPRRQMATGSIWWMNAVDNQICLSGKADNIILSSEKERNCGSFSPKVIAINKEDLRFKFVKDLASNGPKYTEENTLIPAWESFAEARVKQTDLIQRMTEIFKTDGKGCSERTAKKLLGESARFLTTPVVPGSTKAGNWVTMKPFSDAELFNNEDDDVS